MSRFLRDLIEVEIGAQGVQNVEEILGENLYILAFGRQGW